MMERGRSGRKRLILIIEDNVLNRELLSELLSPEYETIGADNGLTGLKILRERYTEISMILLDMQMPVMDGYDFMRLKMESPFLNAVPLIVTTESSNMEEEIRCLELGASDFITKPYNAGVISRRIGCIIRLYESSRALREVEFDRVSRFYTKSAFFYRAQELLDKNPDVGYDLVVSDIDDASLVDERFGNGTLDALASIVGNYMNPYLEKGFVIGRISDSMFAGFIPKLDRTLKETLETHVQTMKEYASKDELLRTLLDGLRFGVVCNVDHNIPVTILCDRAKIALRTIQHRYGCMFAEFDTRLLIKAERVRIIEENMKPALDRGEFQAYYQPKHDARSGRLVGAEALVRWMNPRYGFMPPSEFIPLFETNGFVTELDKYMWDNVCSQLRSWIDQGIDVVPISINASRRDFDRAGLAEHLIRTMEEYRLDPKYLHLEITESMFSIDENRLKEVTHALKEHGVRIELDDFGSGYSLMNALAELPLDVVKLDMSFLRQLHDDKKRKVLEACISLSHKLGMITVSEGVETEEQRAVLLDYGCDWIQGYYYSKPIPAEEFENYLIAHCN